MDLRATPSLSRPLQQRQAWTHYDPITDPKLLWRFFGVRLPGTAKQLTLAGMDADAALSLCEPARLLNEPPPLGYKQFFAVFPEPEDAERLYVASTRVLSAHPLRQARQSVDRLHVTLCSVYDGVRGVPHAVNDAAIAAASRVEAHSLSMRFDTAASFKESGAFMLRSDAATDASVARLRRPLAAVTRRYGLKPVESAQPHMSLVYRCGREVKPHDIEPLQWTASRFALVLSHVGCTRHEWLAAWPLHRR